MAALVGRLAAGADVAEDREPGRVGRHDEHRHPLVGAHLGVGDGHHEEEAGVAGVGGEPLLAVDDPFVAVADGRGAEERRVGAGVGLGHRVAGRDRPVEERLEVLGLLLVGAEVGQDLGVARVRRLAAEHRRCPPRPPQQLVEQRQLHLPVALPAHLRFQVGGPQALLPHLLLQRPHHRQGPLVGLVVGCAQHIVERLDILPQESVDPV